MARIKDRLDRRLYHLHLHGYGLATHTEVEVVHQSLGEHVHVVEHVWALFEAWIGAMSRIAE